MRTITSIFLLVIFLTASFGVYNYYSEHQNNLKLSKTNERIKDQAIDDKRIHKILLDQSSSLRFSKDESNSYYNTHRNNLFRHFHTEKNGVLKNTHTDCPISIYQWGDKNQIDHFISNSMHKYFSKRCWIEIAKHSAIMNDYAFFNSISNQTSTTNAKTLSFIIAAISAKLYNHNKELLCYKRIKHDREKDDYTSLWALVKKFSNNSNIEVVNIEKETPNNIITAIMLACYDVPGPSHEDYLFLMDKDFREIEKEHKAKIQQERQTKEDARIKENAEIEKKFRDGEDIGSKVRAAFGMCKNNNNQRCLDRAAAEARRGGISQYELDKIMACENQKKMLCNSCEGLSKKWDSFIEESPNRRCRSRCASMYCY